MSPQERDEDITYKRRTYRNYVAAFAETVQKLFEEIVSRATCSVTVWICDARRLAAPFVIRTV